MPGAQLTSAFHNRASFLRRRLVDSIAAHGSFATLQLASCAPAACRSAMSLLPPWAQASQQVRLVRVAVQGVANAGPAATVMLQPDRNQNAPAEAPLGAPAVRQDRRRVSMGTVTSSRCLHSFLEIELLVSLPFGHRGGTQRHQLSQLPSWPFPGSGQSPKSMLC